MSRGPSRASLGGGVMRALSMCCAILLLLSGVASTSAGSEPDLNGGRAAVAEVVNTDPENFGVPYLDGDANAADLSPSQA
jgi:hypothetical protein